MARRTEKEQVWVSSGREPKRSCPACFSRLDASTCVSFEAGPHRMQVGDITGCAYCGAFLILESTYGFRFAGADDLDRLPEKLQQILTSFPARNRRRPV